MDITVLHEFAVLVEHLNYTSAAQELNLSQSSLSRHISDLERSLGVELISRKSKLGLTPSGSILLEEASAFFTIEERLMERLKEAKAAIQGNIRIENSIFLQDIKNFFVKAINAFHIDYPRVNFEFVPVKHGLSIAQSLEEGYFDVGLLVHCGNKLPDFSNDEAHFNVVSLNFFQSRMGCYIHETALEKFGLKEAQEAPIDVLKTLPIVLPLRPEYGNFKNDMITLCEAYGFKPSFILTEMKSFESLAMMDMTGCIQIVLECDVDYPSSPFLVNDRCRFLPFRELHYATPYLVFPQISDNAVSHAFYERVREMTSQ